MENSRQFIYQGILLIGISTLLIMGGAGLARGEASFTGIEPFEQGFTVTSGMHDYDPRVLIVNFGESNEVTNTKLSVEQVFDFTALLDAPVDHSPDTAKPLPITFDKPPDDFAEQPGGIPEPSSFLLLGLGILLVIRNMWRKNFRN
jgi:hypothetical protein